MPGLKTNEREGTRAVLRHARLSPYKVREVLDLVRGKPVHEAEDILRFSERDAAIVVGKVLHSAVANAENNDELDPEELYVSACFADEGTTIKRWRPRARGRATRIRKRTSHITVIVSRLPDSDLLRLQQRRRAEQLVQRARRVAGARRAAGDTRSRAERRHGVTWEEAEAEHDHEHDHDEAVTGEAAEGTGAETTVEGEEPTEAEAGESAAAEAGESAAAEAGESTTAEAGQPTTAEAPDAEPTTGETAEAPDAETTAGASAATEAEVTAEPAATAEDEAGQATEAEAPEAPQAEVEDEKDED
jgi:large subunit ribosomal protein L22